MRLRTVIVILTDLLLLFPEIPTETYHMIDSCDPAIATWSHDGCSFIIHDVTTFTDVRIMCRMFGGIILENASFDQLG